MRLICMQWRFLKTHALGEGGPTSNLRSYPPSLYSFLGNEQIWGIDRDLKPSNSYQIPFEPIIRYKNDMYSLGLPIFCFAWERRSCSLKRSVSIKRIKGATQTEHFDVANERDSCMANCRWLLSLVHTCAISISTRKKEHVLYFLCLCLCRLCYAYRTSVNQALPFAAYDAILATLNWQRHKML